MKRLLSRLAAAVGIAAAAVAIFAANGLSTSGDEVLAGSASNHFMSIPK